MSRARCIAWLSVAGLLGACGAPGVCGAPRAARTDAFRLALPGYRFAFPRDHGAHPEFMTEWWYFTGHLQTTAGSHSKRRFSYQLTFFRHALAPRLKNRRSRWATRDIMPAHFALTDESGQKFYYTDRISRAALGLAGADAQIPSRSTSQSTFAPRIWLGDWVLRFRGRRGERQTLRASGFEESNGARTPFALQLDLRSLKPPAIHGINGVSQKSAGRGRASHYYSLTRLACSGSVRVGAQKYFVRGQSWFDHEFGSSQLSAAQTGWDWFSLQLDDGRELMLYQLRLRPRGIDPFSSGTIVEKNGATRHLRARDFRIAPLATWRSPRSGALYPARWRVTLPREGLTLEISPTLAAQELDTKRSTGITYWEGGVRASGTQRGKTLRGVGYVELTGYAREFQSTF